MPKYLEGAVPLYRNACRENINKEFSTVAGTPGAPKRPTYPIVAESVEEVLDVIVSDAAHVSDAGGLLLIASPYVGDGVLLDVAQGMNCCVITQKEYYKVSRLTSYSRISSLFRRGDLPDGILNHLVRRDGQNDHGMLEGVRLAGNFYPTVVKRVNEKRPLIHGKMAIFLVPKGKKEKKLVPYSAFGGSANHSHQSRFSLELSHRSTHPETVMGYLKEWAFIYSLTEGLYNPSFGMQPTYRWMPKAQKYSLGPACSCKSRLLVPMWLNIPEDNEGEIVRYLVCTECGERYPYLKEFEEVVR